MIRRTTSTLRFRLLTNVPSPICLCKLSSCKACHEIGTILSSPKHGHTTSWLGRRSARRTAGQGAAGQTRVPAFPSARKPNVPSALQGIVNNCSERLLSSKNRRNPMLSGGRTKRLLDQQFNSGTTCASLCWLLNSVPIGT